LPPILVFKKSRSVDAANVLTVRISSWGQCKNSTAVNRRGDPDSNKMERCRSLGSINGFGARRSDKSSSMLHLKVSTV
jgi:hypothetical protein